MTDTQKRAIPELSLDTQTLERVLMSAQIGDIVTYSTLTASIGRDVTATARGNLQSARRRLERERIIFGAVVNVGLKRLDDMGKIAAGQSHIARSRNQARFAQTKTKSVDDFDALPNHLKVTHNVTLALAGALRSMTAPRKIKKLGEAITHPTASFSTRESLKLMAPLL